MTSESAGGLLASPRSRTFEPTGETLHSDISNALLPDAHPDIREQPIQPPAPEPNRSHDSRLIRSHDQMAAYGFPDTSDAVDRTTFGRVRSIGGFVGSLAVLYSMMWPMLSIPFGVIDDHEIPDIIGNRRRLPLSQVGSAIADRWNEPIGRFRPGYWVLRVFESALAGRNAEFWFINRFVLAAVTLGAIYLVARQHIGVLASATVALIPFLGPQFETWRRLGTNETYAVPMMCVGIALVHRAILRSRAPSSMWPGFLFLTLAGATKENFLLVTVVVVCGVALHHGIGRLVRRDWIVIGCTMAIWAANGAAMAVKLKHHGSVYSQPHTLGSALTFFRYALDVGTFWQSMSIGVLLLLGLIVAHTVKAASGRRAQVLLLGDSGGSPIPAIPRVSPVGIAAASVLSVGLQIGFYSGAPQTGRYLYPIAFLAALVWAAVAFLVERCCLNFNAVVRYALVPLAIPLLMAVPVSNAFASARDQISVSKSENEAFQAGLRRIVDAAANSRARSIVIQPEDPWLDMERTMSMARFLNAETGLPIMTLPPTKPGQGLSARLAQEMQSWSSNGSSRLVPYVASTTCLSVIFGTNTPVYPSSVPTADSGY